MIAPKEPVMFESTNRTLTLEQLLKIKDIDSKAAPFTDRVTAVEAILMGQAPDTGLFVPVEAPQITNDELRYLKGKPPKYAGYLLFRKHFTEKEISDEQLMAACERILSYEYPITRLQDRQHLLWHSESPTIDFKNTGARSNAAFLEGWGNSAYDLRGPIPDGRTLFVPPCFDRNLVQVPRQVRPLTTYLRITTTSGDTGGAVGRADYGIANLISILIYPLNNVSPTQEMIMTHIGGNIIAIGVSGMDGKVLDFSPLQDGLAKRLFADRQYIEFLEKRGIKLTSGNSIAVGRWVSQAVHFIWSYAQLADPIGEPMYVSTGIGNMGHGAAGEYARMMGVPLFSIWPSNENDPVPRWFANGDYKPLTDAEKAMDVWSNSMIVKNPSNIARIAYWYGGCIDKDGRVQIEPDLDGLKQNAWACRVSFDEEKEGIRKAYKFPVELVAGNNVYNHNGFQVIDPHGSCSLMGMWKAIDAGLIPKNALMMGQVTAGPYKYKEKIDPLLRIDLPEPAQLSWFKNRPFAGRTMMFDYEVFMNLLTDIANNPRAYLMHQ